MVDTDHPTPGGPGLSEEIKMRTEITLTDDQILDAFDELHGSPLVDRITDVGFTRESLADFTAAREGYSQRGTIEQKANGLIMRDVQAAKGHKRGDLYVIDFGAVRAFVRI